MEVSFHFSAHHLNFNHLNSCFYLQIRRRMPNILKNSIQKNAFAPPMFLRFFSAPPSGAVSSVICPADSATSADFHLRNLTNHLRNGWTEAALALAKNLISSRRDFFPSPIYLYQSLSREVPVLSSQASSLVVSACAQLHLADEGLRFITFLSSTSPQHFPSIVTCKQMLDILVSDRRYSDVLSFFSQILASGIRPDIFFYNKAIEATVKLGDVQRAVQLMNQMENSYGILPNVFTFNVLISRLWKERRAEDAKKMFDDMLNRKVLPKIVTYNTMIDGYCKAGDLDAAFRVWDQMLSALVEPNLTTFNSLLWGLCHEGRTDEAKDLLKDMKGRGLTPDAFTYSTLFMGYLSSGKKGSIDLFEECVRNGVQLEAHTCSVLLSALCKDGDVLKAEDVLSRMVDMGLIPTTVIYNLIVDGYCRIGDMKEAFSALRRMESLGLKVNHITYNSLINGMCKLQRLGEVEKLLKEMREKGVAQTIETMNTLIDAYSRAGEFSRCFEILEEMEEKMGIKPNIISYGSLLNGFCKRGKIHEAEVLFSDIVLKGIKVNEKIYNMLIDAYSTNGDFSKSKEMIQDMKRSGVCPNIVTYNSVIKGLCGNGQLSAAEELVKQLKNDGPSLDVITCNTLMAAYCNYNDIQKAFKVFKEMEELKIDPNLASYYILINKMCLDGKMLEVYNLYQHMLRMKLDPDRIIYTTMISGYIGVGNYSMVHDLEEEMRNRGILLDEISCFSGEGS